jgi:pyruvate,orthophosphate dikinase
MTIFFHSFLSLRAYGREEHEVSAKNVYYFGPGGSEGSAEMKNLLGGKGAGLAEMSNLGLPVPAGFTITTEVCTAYYDNKGNYPGVLEAEVKAALARVEKAMGSKFGDAKNPF